MSIIVITGPAKSGKTTIATALRNNQIAKGEGGLLIDEDNDGELDILIEKLIVGVRLSEKPNVNAIPWKKNPMVVLVGDKVKVLDNIEARVPGFVEKFGPVFNVETK